MKLEYIGSQELRIENYGIINYGDIISDERLVLSLKYRKDFKLIKDKPVEVIKTSTVNKE
jgi:hypothetical protein